MTKDYYGTKRVTAWPENKVSPDTEPGDFIVKDGYAVKYADGYVSWSPKDVFEAAYKPIDAMGFEGALAAMKAGHKVVRQMWVEFYGSETICLVVKGERIGVVYAEDAQNDWDDNWLDWRANVDSGDLLAEDWMIVE